MKNREVEKRLKQAVENTTPDVLARIMADCDNSKGEIIVMTKKNNKGLVRRIAYVAAALIIVAGGAVIGYNSHKNANAIASTVSFDVNPSVELELNQKANVVKANALNTDGEKILQNLKLKGADASTATSAIIGSLLQNGYIDELANSILISVEDTDDARAARLQEELTQQAAKALEEASANAAIVAQHLKAEAYDEIAEELSISAGKAALIEKIIAANPSYTEKDLADMSVNELNLILSNPKNEVKEVATSGQASEKKYIGADKAMQIALEYVGFEKADTYGLEVDFDSENGKLIYEVEFYVRGKSEYEIHIDALTGEVLTKSNLNQAAASDSTAATQKAEDIGSAKAKEIALAKAGVKADDVESLKITSEYDDGRLEYSVKFIKGSKTYEYEIDAETGKITDFDIDSKYDDDDYYEAPAANPNVTTAGSGDIGSEKAKEIALSNAGAKESEVQGLRVEREYDDGKIEYSVEFRFNSKEYEYEINGATGVITDRETEYKLK